MTAPLGLAEPDDTELVAGTLAGDREAAALYDRYADRLHDFCHSMLRDHHEAADAMQDTFVVAAERLRQLRDPQRLRPWLYAIARSQSLRRLRSRSRLAPVTEAGEMADPGTGPAEAAEQQALRDLVWNAAAGLSQRDRALLDLHLRHGLEGAELGEAMGVSASHAYVLLTRLRDQVERSLGALLVARLGRRDCAELEAILGGWDGRFSPLIRKRVARHVDTCSTCAERRKRVASPWALLSTVPLVPAPTALRDQVLDRFELVAAQRPGASHRRGTKVMAGIAATVLAGGAAAVALGVLADRPSSPAAAPAVAARPPARPPPRHRFPPTGRPRHRSRVPWMYPTPYLHPRRRPRGRAAGLDPPRRSRLDGDTRNRRPAQHRRPGNDLDGDTVGRVAGR